MVSLRQNQLKTGIARTNLQLVQPELDPALSAQLQTKAKAESAPAPAQAKARATQADVRGARARHAQAGAGVQSQLAASAPKKAEGTVMGVAKGTGYYPANTRMEGGFVDKRDTKLNTLQDFLDGKAPYVSIALDKNLYKSGQVKYGDKFRIPELEKKYGRPIEFRAVDTGGAFTNKGFGRVDICTANKAASLDPTVNGKLTLVKVDDVPGGARPADFAPQAKQAQALEQTYGPGAAQAKQAYNQQLGKVRSAMPAARQAIQQSPGASSFGGPAFDQLTRMLGGDRGLAELMAQLLMAIQSGDPDAIRGASDGLSRGLNSRARSALGGNKSAQGALGRMGSQTGAGKSAPVPSRAGNAPAPTQPAPTQQGPTQPVTPGVNGTAAFDSTSKVGQRNQMKTGRITVNGNTYQFRSGGHGRGNLPPGDYQVTKHMQSRGDRSMNVGGVGYSFAMSDKYDARVGDTRSLLRIHPDGGTAGTMGCIGIVGDAATQAAFRRDMNAEIERNGGSYTLRVG